MSNKRLSTARSAYEKRNLQQSRQNHTPGAIASSLQEEHANFSLSDVILGGQDGLVNVLGVILGVAAASGDARIIQAAGLAAAFAESVSMGAVAYTSTRADSEHYESELAREQWEIENNPEGEREEIRQIYVKRGFGGELLQQVVDTITKNKQVWLDVMMSEELKLTSTSKHQAFRSAIIVGVSAIIGSLIPLVPFFITSVSTSVIISVTLSAVTLFIVGAYKAKVTVGSWYRSGIELTVIGIVSALIGYGIGLLFKSPIP